MTRHSLIYKSTKFLNTAQELLKFSKQNSTLLLISPVMQGNRCVRFSNFPLFLGASIARFVFDEDNSGSLNQISSPIPVNILHNTK